MFVSWCWRVVGAESIKSFIEGQAFLRLFDLALPLPPPSPVPSASCPSLSVFLCVADRAYCWERGGRRWGRARSYDHEKAWSSINHSVLSGWGYVGVEVYMWPHESLCIYCIFNIRVNRLYECNIIHSVSMKRVTSNCWWLLTADNYYDAGKLHKVSLSPEFLDIILTKNSSLLLHAIHSLSTRKTDSTLVLKILTKKSAKQENSSLFVNDT